MIKEFGYIKLSRFTRNCTNEVRSAILDLESKNNVEGLILDLRGNPGGLLNEAIKLCNLFIEKNTVVVETKGRNTDWNKLYKTKENPYNTEIPLIILVNEGSASASEIVAGTMQDLDRGVVIGKQTFGKGLVQQTKKLNYNSQLKLTVAKYYTPSGRCIQTINYSDSNKIVPDSLRTEYKTKNNRSVYDGGGIDPDIEVERDSIPKIIYSLMQKQLIFEFGNFYAAITNEVEQPKSLDVSEEIYSKFKEFIYKKSFDFVTNSEEKIEDLIDVLNFEGYKDSIINSGLIQLLKDEIQKLKITDIEKYKKEISKLILSDIAVRYYYNEGRIEALMKYDDEIKSAINTLENKKNYKNILGK